MGSRQAGNEKAVAWAEAAGEKAGEGSFADAAAHGELLFNCTSGIASVEALTSAGAQNLEGKVLVDVANAFDYATGMPPGLFVCNDDSLGERIQATFGGARVVKALNTMNCEVMVDPGRVPGEHVVVIAGNDEGAKGTVTELLSEFGWPGSRVVDLGDITAARGTEMYMALWIRLWGKLGSGDFNIALNRAA